MICRFKLILSARFLAVTEGYPSSRISCSAISMSLARTVEFSTPLRRLEAIPPPSTPVPVCLDLRAFAWDLRELGVRCVERLGRELVRGKFLHRAQGHALRHRDPLITTHAREVLVEHSLGRLIGEQ